MARNLGGIVCTKIDRHGDTLYLIVVDVYPEHAVYAADRYGNPVCVKYTPERVVTTWCYKDDISGAVSAWQRPRYEAAGMA